jgi:chaperonin GroES
MNLRPLQDRIIVKRVEEETMTAGGLYIPETAKEKPQQGEVVAVGKGKRAENGTVHPIDLKVGDKVLFGKYAGSEVKLDGNDFLIMREDDILGVIEK